MLTELHISNLAVIADARIELSSGLNCFTGATGAGKSLVIGAIELLLGLRPAAEMLRAGADEARIVGAFDTADPRLLRIIEQATDVPVTADGGELLLTRRIYASGRSSVSLNGNPITLAMLKQVAEALVDVHGQHDHQYLLKPANQLEVLDDYANLDALRGEYHAVYTRLREAQERLSDLVTGARLREQRLELYRFQANEIDTGELQPGEYEELGARASVLSNVEKLRKEAGAAYAALYDADGALIERLQMMSGVLSELADLDHALKPIAATLRDATASLTEGAYDLGRYTDKLDLDPAELAEVNDRLTLLNRLANKYGGTIEAVQQHRDLLRGQIDQLENAEHDFGDLQKQIDPMNARLAELAAELTSKRKQAARKLGPAIERQLGELLMDKAKFSVQLTPVDPAASGADACEFVVQTNPGLPPQPLRKVASGGELGRIMLALKGVLAGGDRVSVLVFDEIDANVGGRLGAIIGDKLRGLAGHHQVLCITHLPQIAAYADRHLTVRKQTFGDETRTTVREMAGDERVEELAEMIGGHRITDTTRAQARELLDTGRLAGASVRQPPEDAPASTVAAEGEAQGKRAGMSAAGAQTKRAAADRSAPDRAKGDQETPVRATAKRRTPRPKA